MVGMGDNTVALQHKAPDQRRHIEDMVAYQLRTKNPDSALVVEVDGVAEEMMVGEEEEETIVHSENGSTKWCRYNSRPAVVLLACRYTNQHLSEFLPESCDDHHSATDTSSTFICISDRFKKSERLGE